MKSRTIEESAERYVAHLDKIAPRVVGARGVQWGDIRLPRWNGEHVRHLLVATHKSLWFTSAHGEFLQFGRYLTEARKRCDVLTIAVHHQMHAMAKRCFRADHVCEPADLFAVAKEADAGVTLFLDLAQAVGEGHRVPSPITALPERVPALCRGKFHVGLCWSASAAGRARSLPFDAFRPMRPLRWTQWHSLQVGNAAEAAAPWVQRHELVDYDATAGLITALDAVVTVDTSVAHLAASMGKPTHLVLAGLEDWRWGNGSRTPWYPTVRIYRGDLGRILPKLADALLREQLTARADSTVPAVEPSSIGMEPLKSMRVPSQFMSDADLAALLALLRQVGPRRVLEIGVNEGRTAKFLLDNVPGIEGYQGVDVLPGYRFERTDQQREIPRAPGRHVLGDSRFELILRERGTFDLAARDLAPCDVAFIDGDHGRDAVLHDTALARLLVRPGGVIVWHDYGNRTTPDVQTELDSMRLAGCNLWRVAGSWIAFERV